MSARAVRDIFFRDKSKPDNIYLQLSRGMSWGCITVIVGVLLWMVIRP